MACAVTAMHREQIGVFQERLVDEDCSGEIHDSFPTSTSQSDSPSKDSPPRSSTLPSPPPVNTSKPVLRSKPKSPLKIAPSTKSPAGLPAKSPVKPKASPRLLKTKSTCEISPPTRQKLHARRSLSEIGGLLTEGRKLDSNDKRDTNRDSTATNEGDSLFVPCDSEELAPSPLRRRRPIRVRRGSSCTSRSPSPATFGENGQLLSPDAHQLSPLATEKQSLSPLAEKQYSPTTRIAWTGESPTSQEEAEASKPNVPETHRPEPQQRTRSMSFSSPPSSQPSSRSVTPEHSINHVNHQTSSKKPSPSPRLTNKNTQLVYSPKAKQTAYEPSGGGRGSAYQPFSQGGYVRRSSKGALINQKVMEIRSRSTSPALTNGLVEKERATSARTKKAFAMGFQRFSSLENIEVDKPVVMPRLKRQSVSEVASPSDMHRTTSCPAVNAPQPRRPRSRTTGDNSMVQKLVEQFSKAEASSLSPVNSLERETKTSAETHKQGLTAVNRKTPEPADNPAPSEKTLSKTTPKTESPKKNSSPASKLFSNPIMNIFSQRRSKSPRWLRKSAQADEPVGCGNGDGVNNSVKPADAKSYKDVDKKVNAEELASPKRRPGYVNVSGDARSRAFSEPVSDALQNIADTHNLQTSDDPYEEILVGSPKARRTTIAASSDSNVVSRRKKRANRYNSKKELCLPATNSMNSCQVGSPVTAVPCTPSPDIDEYGNIYENPADSALGSTNQGQGQQQDSGIESPQRSLDDEVVSPNGRCFTYVAQDETIFDLSNEQAKEVIYEAVEVRRGDVRSPPLEKVSNGLPVYNRVEGRERSRSGLQRDSGYQSQIGRQSSTSSLFSPEKKPQKVDKHVRLGESLDADPIEETIYDEVEALDVYNTGDTSDDSKEQNIYEDVPLEGSMGESQLLSSNGLIHLERQRLLWRDLPEVQSRGLLEQLSPKEVKLQEAMFEILSSEESYNQSLRVLVDFFMKNIVPSGSTTSATSPGFQQVVIDRAKHHRLFSNAPTLLEVSNNFLQDLRDRLSENVVMPTMCDIVLTHVRKHFAPYIRYCTNQIYQLREVKNLCADPNVGKLVHVLQNSQDARKLPLQSYLLLPMQRITRLPLLMLATFDHIAEDSPHMTVSRQALQELQLLVVQCNDGARCMEQMEGLIDLQSKIRFDSKIKHVPLVSQKRFLKRSGKLIQLLPPAGKGWMGKSGRIEKTKVQVFVFNDLVLIAKKKSDDSFKVIDYCSITLTIVEECPAEVVSRVSASSHTDGKGRTPGLLSIGSQKSIDHVGESPQGGSPTGEERESALFKLVFLENALKKNQELILMADSLTTKARWLEALSEEVKEVEGTVVYDLWNCPQRQALYNYSPHQPDELALQVNDVIKVLRKMEDGWCHGELLRDGSRGWFPTSYTEEIQSEQIRAKHLRQRRQLLLAAQKQLAEKTSPDERADV